MASIRGLSSLWDLRLRSAPVRTFAVGCAVGGLSCLLGSVFPPTPESPVELFRTLGALTLAASAVVWIAGDRITPSILQVLVATVTLATSLAVYRSATALGAVVMAFAYLWVCVYAGLFLSRSAARAQMSLVAAASGAALLANNNEVPVAGWLFIVASLLIVGETLSRQSTRLRHEAHTDSLTGVLNRKGLALAAERAFSLADRTGLPLTVAVVDLDDFKQINDREGHLAGDRLLVDLANAWTAEVEPSDVVARLGGDEFLVILVGTGEEESARLFQRLRFVSPITWSAGVIRRRQGEDLNACLDRADKALYGVKGARPKHSDLFRRTSPVAATRPG